MSYDLNDARVDALRVARESGMDTPTFNRIWRIIQAGQQGTRPDAEALA